MLSMAPNIVFVPNIMQNAERKQRTQNTNTAHNRLPMHCVAAETVRFVQSNISEI